MLSLKDGVDLSDLSGEAVFMAVVVDQVYAANGIPSCVVTSGRDGQHSAKSKHYEKPCQALDFRTHTVPVPKQIKIRAEIKAALGRDFDVVLESDHLHVEHDPK